MDRFNPARNCDASTQGTVVEEALTTIDRESTFTSVEGKSPVVANSSWENGVHRLAKKVAEHLGLVARAALRSHQRARARLQAVPVLGIRLSSPAHRGHGLVVGVVEEDVRAQAIGASEAALADSEDVHALIG